MQSVRPSSPRSACTLPSSILSSASKFSMLSTCPGERPIWNNTVQNTQLALGSLREKKILIPQALHTDSSTKRDPGQGSEYSEFQNHPGDSKIKPPEPLHNQETQDQVRTHTRSLQIFTNVTHSHFLIILNKSEMKTPRQYAHCPVFLQL